MAISLNSAGLEASKIGELSKGNLDLRLDLACTIGDTDLAEKTINAGANINFLADGIPLICMAVKNSFLKIAKLLVKKGVDTQVKDEKGRTPALLTFDYTGRYMPGFDSLFPRTAYENKYYAYNFLSLIYNHSDPLKTDEGAVYYPNAIGIDFSKHLVACFEKFKELEFLQITKDEVDQISTAILCDLSDNEAEWSVERIKSGKLCFLTTGWSEHEVQFVFSGNYMAICNRGEGSEGRNSIEVFNIDPHLITPENLKCILRDNAEALNSLEGQKLLYETFPALVGGRPNGVIAQKWDGAQPKKQKSGNCTIAAKKAAIRFAWAMLLINRGIPLETAIEIAKKESKLFSDYFADYAFGEFTSDFPEVFLDHFAEDFFEGGFPRESLPKPLLDSMLKKQERYLLQATLFDGI